MTMLKPLLNIYALNLDHANRLVADLDEQSMAVQPAPGMNHAAWIIGHLACTCDVVMMVLGQPKVAPAGWRERFGARTIPVADRAAYPDKQTLLDALAHGHEQVAAAVGALDMDQLQQPPVDERFRQCWPSVHDALLHVMVGHEQMHLGQLSAWRRVQGMAAV